VRPIGLGSCDGNEQEIRFDLAAIGSNARDLDGTLARIDWRLRQKIAQLHRVSFALTSSI
jgi:hypothetical protein